MPEQESTRPATAAGLDLSYHHLYVTTAQIPRTRLSGLPYGLWITCNRVTGSAAGRCGT